MIYTLTANPSLDKLYIVSSLTVGEYNRGQATRYDAGGKGINVSRCLMELGKDSTVVGFFGGNIGKILIESLQNDGLSVETVTIAGESRSNVTMIESSTNTMTKLNEFGPCVDLDDMHKMLDIIQTRTQVGDVWVLSGSLPLGLPNGFYAMAIEAIHKKGGLAFLDTSGMWLIYGYQAAPFALRINQVEAETALGKQLETKKDCFNALDKFRKRGIALSAISLGEEGAVFADKDTILDVRAPRVSAKTVVGAGDAMMSMLVHAYIEKWPFEKMARWCVAAGSASVMKDGTSIAEVSLIEALVDQIEVKEI